MTPNLLANLTTSGVRRKESRIAETNARIAVFNYFASSDSLLNRTISIPAILNMSSAN